MTTAADVVLAILVVEVVASLLVYRDAKRNSTRSPFLWALAVFFGGILGIVLYFLLGRDATPPRRDYENRPSGRSPWNRQQ